MQGIGLSNHGIVPVFEGSHLQPLPNTMDGLSHSIGFPNFDAEHSQSTLMAANANDFGIGAGGAGTGPASGSVGITHSMGMAANGMSFFAAVVSGAEQHDNNHPVRVNGAADSTSSSSSLFTTSTPRPKSRSRPPTAAAATVATTTTTATTTPTLLSASSAQRRRTAVAPALPHQPAYELHQHYHRQLQQQLQILPRRDSLSNLGTMMALDDVRTQVKHHSYGRVCMCHQ